MPHVHENVLYSSLTLPLPPGHHPRGGGGKNDDESPMGDDEDDLDDEEDEIMGFKGKETEMLKRMMN